MALASMTSRVGSFMYYYYFLQIIITFVTQIVLSHWINKKTS
jgi:hypothetical protein